jgi:cation diffusion facilitator family transporter
MNNQEKLIRSTYLSIIANIFLALVKGVTGVLGNSYALIADAIESITDVISSVLLLFGLKYSVKPADENHPYGHGKAEPIATFIVVVFLLVSATAIAYQSIHNIRSEQVTPSSFTLWILGLVIILKELFYRVMNRRGKEIKSSALQADAWHHRSDALTSLIAFIGISIALIFGEGFEKADDWAALAASGFIVYNAFMIFRPALGEIMDEHVYDEMINEIRSISAGVGGVLGTEKCFVRKSGLYFHIDLHIIVNGKLSVREGHEIAHILKDALKEKLPEINDVLIHVEPDRPE